MFVIFFLGWLVFSGLFIFSLFKRNKKAKRNFIFGLLCFVLFIALTPKDDKAPKKTEAKQVQKTESEKKKEAEVKKSVKTPEQIAKEKARAEAEAKEKAKADAIKKQQEATKKKEAAIKKAHKKYQEWIESLFSPWDGSIREVNDMIKENMNDPDSFKHVETRYSDLGFEKGIRFIVKFRGTNAFGGVVTNQFTGTIDYKTMMIHGKMVE
ncbi:hypothetical protein [Bacillus sp. X1(2014)]|uniref:hypothetical protein n=1 Tax=Bacillus sp. X1(2014) TaxID=1565991 RepID=UPI00119E93DA|nr:hypothetical protein [Bacillus sp. X1(2014)]